MRWSLRPISSLHNSSGLHFEGTKLTVVQVTIDMDLERIIRVLATFVSVAPLSLFTPLEHFGLHSTKNYLCQCRFIYPAMVHNSNSTCKKDTVCNHHQWTSSSVVWLQIQPRRIHRRISLHKSRYCFLSGTYLPALKLSARTRILSSMTGLRITLRHAGFGYNAVTLFYH